MQAICYYYIIITFVLIFSGPTALLSHGIAKGKKVTSHPGVKDKMEASGRFKEVSLVIENVTPPPSPGHSHMSADIVCLYCEPLFFRKS